MRKMKKFGNSVKMIAHRGYSAYERENTAAAFIAAGNRSYFGIECDIRITKDNVFVVCHDADTARVSPAKHVINDSTYKELSVINLYDIHTQDTPPHLKIPTLKEYLAIARKYRKHSFFEIKPELTNREIEQFLTEITAFGLVDAITIISFNYSNLLRLRRLSPELRLQYLMGELPETAIELCKNINAGADVHYKNLTARDIARFHKHDIEVNVWTVDDAAVAKKFVRWKVDYITTNILE